MAIKKVNIGFLSQYSPKYCYANDSICFSWLGLPHKNVFPQITDWHSCRETFTNVIKKWVLKGTDWEYIINMNTRRTRIAVIRKYNNNMKEASFTNNSAYDFKWMKHAKRILNLFERYLGWGLSTLSYCNNEELVGAKSRANVFMFSGSAKWMRAPQLMSLYLLIIRLSKHDYFQTLKSLDDMEAFNKLMFIKKHSDALYWNNIQLYLFMILDNINELFLHRPIKEAYLVQGGTHGISRMLAGISDLSTAHAFNEVKKKFELAKLENKYKTN